VVKRAVRRSQLISPWGVGQMINFPGDESLMVCGLDAWEKVYQSAPDGQEEFIIREERLEKRLGVSHFRLPPEFRSRRTGVRNAELRIPCVRFPLWHYCPYCGSMEKLSPFGSRQKCKGPNYSDGLSCHNLPERRRPWLIPVRFIAICEEGHIEDFPFMEWVHRDRPHDSFCNLRLLPGRGSSALSGIKIVCSCSQSRTMSMAFNDHSLDKIKKCSGNRPWLGETENDEETCGCSLRVVQRGASNVYFPEVRSSIYLPYWDKTTNRKAIEIVEQYWSRISGHRVNGQLDRSIIDFLAEIKDVDPEQLYKAAQEKLSSQYGGATEDKIEDSEETYRRMEYEAILSGAGGENQDFYVVNVNGAEYERELSTYLKSVALLHKIKETRAYVGFSRLLPENNRTVSELKRELYFSPNIDWLPAIVVRGEGIFFEFDGERLNNWAELPQVKQRTELLNANVRAYRVSSGQNAKKYSAKFILLHTFAHLIINQLSYSCGYGSSALRERIYCDELHPDKPMNGVLIYTASGDSEGSLGGLVRQGQLGRLEEIVLTALQEATWCSSDPICMESKGQGPNSCNLAACHTCALLPETSCENGNRILDRLLVVGSPSDPDLGYFARWDEAFS